MSGKVEYGIFWCYDVLYINKSLFFIHILVPRLLKPR